MSVQVLVPVWYLDITRYDLELDFLAHISLAMQNHVYEAKDRFRVKDLTILTHGTAARRIFGSNFIPVLAAPFDFTPAAHRRHSAWDCAS